MAAPRLLFIADRNAHQPRDPLSPYPGGAEQTDAALLAAAPWPVERARPDEVSPAALGGYDAIVVANLDRPDRALVEALARSRNHVLFEHDLRLCRWRGNFPEAPGPFHRLGQRCLCWRGAARRLVGSCRGMIYLTSRQRAIYRANPFFREPPAVVLGSSVFAADFFARVERRRGQPPATAGPTCVVFSPHPIKGTAEALAWCRARGIEPKILRGLPPGDLLDRLERAQRLVFLPRALEPAGRLPVEARFLGCEVVVNEHVGVAGEPWWRLDDRAALAHLRGAAARFWAAVAGFAGLDRAAAQADAAGRDDG